MRTLLLLRGAPGAGKSTFIREHGLQPYTLCADDFRTMITDPVLDKEGSFCITQSNDADAWRLLYEALEKRMRRGDFTVIDATNCSPKMITHYKVYAEKHRYQIYYLDFDVPLDELLMRNKTREEYKRVPAEAVKRMYTMFKEIPIQKYCKKIEKLEDIENYYTDNLDDYDRVVVFGDIHGCFTAFTDALKQINNGSSELNPKIKYIFSGDLLDRGLENKQMMNWLIDHADNKNVTLITGNYDQYLIDWVFDTFPKRKDGSNNVPFEFKTRTLPQLLEPYKAVTEDGHKEYDESKIYTFKSAVRKTVRHFVQCYAFTFHGTSYFVNHGGLSSLPKMTYIPTIQMTKGVGGYDYDIDKVWDASYEAGRTQGFIQIHGHRKPVTAMDSKKGFYEGTEHSISLEGRVEYGGYLLYCDITPNGHEVHGVRNNVYREVSPAVLDNVKAGLKTNTTSNTGIPDTANEMTNKILHSSNVKAKVLPDHNLMSLNFDRDAFYGAKWDEATMRARGLFVDRNTGDIKLRSYNKFFNVGERPETTIEALQRNIAWPVKAYYKANGFLGIMSVVDGEEVLATKSTTEGPYADMFREVWNTLELADRVAMKQIAEEQNCSFVFEVCNVKDKHIIDFDKNHLWLLDIIPNQYDIGGVDINEEFSESWKDSIKYVSPNLKRKKLLGTFNSMDEVVDYARERSHDRDIEGIVCQDRNGYMFKMKFRYYTTVKKLRSALQIAQRTYSRGIPYGEFQDAKTMSFISYFVKKPFDEWKNMHIIDAVKEYEKETGNKVV